MTELPTSWRATVESLESGRARRVVLARSATPLRTSEVAALWRSDESFRTFFSELLAEAPFAAFTWETPPVTKATFDREFECVLVDEPALALTRANPEAFRDVFETAASTPVVEFENLGGDARLVAPRPEAPREACAHLAAFVRNAPQPLLHSFWIAVGTALERTLDPEPVWLSTAGLGVPWLHARLDSRPKYYTLAPYRSAAST